ncbi:signal transduction histidine kinase [Salirhabdus euzebyi]|uniref:histidine kinase n=1 Tax=Salirhabdus euzebyi TaxID=394506 RepID=A0A841PSS5_9BACI|nr:ATP-binding protein [Salirhabdus euzebyi]MBB6451859.1 signal transduction histidine kinase [Salirhabdus euzebyi]
MSLKDVSIPFSHHNLSNGGHIIYTYSDEKKYLDNVTNFIMEGVTKREGIVIVEKNHYIIQIKNRLINNGISQDDINQIVFVDTGIFYQEKVEEVIDHLASIVDPFIQKAQPLRTWGNVKIKSLLSNLYIYECSCDQFVCNHQTISVCAYDGRELSASNLADLLKVHQYYMTDESIIPSGLYKRDSHPIPSITEQIKLEREFDESLIRSEQLTTAGQLAAGICHEIRNPLTTIKGFFQLLKYETSRSNYIQVIEGELDRIEKITSELLLLAKPHAELLEGHNLIELVEDVALLLRSQATIKNILIQTNYEATEIMVFCEHSKIKQVLINILKNAMEVMENGKIEIEVSIKQRQAVLTIKDEGPGISEENLRRIGEPFFTTKEGGTGLGLLICFNIIKNHNGTIKVESEEGKGTTFMIQMPILTD